MKKLIGIFIVFIIVSGNSKAESTQEIIEQLNKNIHATEIYNKVWGNAHDICLQEHNYLSVSESEYKRIGKICDATADNTAIATAGITSEQIQTTQSDLIKKLCFIYKKTKSAKIKFILDDNNLSIPNEAFHFLHEEHPECWFKNY